MSDDKVTRKQLEDYQAVEKAIQELEKNNPLVPYDDKMKELESLKTIIQKQQYDVEIASRNTRKEKQDVENLLAESVQGLLKQSQDDYNNRMTKEQEEYMEALSLEELLRKELKESEKKKESLLEVTAKMKVNADKLRELYEKRDDMLAAIFDGEYGSEMENHLEAEFEAIKDRKQKIEVAHYKWKNARVLLQAAVNQLCFASNRWREVGSTPNNQPTVKYNYLSETRNNLVAAIQNLTSCHKYLPSITFPYITLEEIQTLTTATNNMYTDMQSLERHGHAAQCYNITYKRAAALLQWFNMVIDDTIKKDLLIVSKEAQEKELALRKERLRLIRERVVACGGNVDGLDTLDPTGKTENIPMKTDEIPEGIQVVKPEGVDDRDQIDVREMMPPTPVPLGELAPVPNKDELIGQISYLKEEHQKHTDDIKKAQELNKVRLEQALQKKRMDRHQRRQLQSAKGTRSAE